MESTQLKASRSRKGTSSDPSLFPGFCNSPFWVFRRASKFLHRHAVTPLEDTAKTWTLPQQAQGGAWGAAFHVSHKSWSHCRPGSTPEWQGARGPVNSVTPSDHPHFSIFVTLWTLNLEVFCRIILVHGLENSSCPWGMLWVSASSCHSEE